MLKDEMVKFDQPENLEPKKLENSTENPSTKNFDDIEIFQGDPIVDRKSTFQAFYSKVFTVTDAKRFREKLLQNRKIENATHNMFVYKVQENGIVKADSDEDGENGAGKYSRNILRISRDPFPTKI